MEGPEGSPYQVCRIQILLAPATSLSYTPCIPSYWLQKGGMQRQEAHCSILDAKRCSNLHAHYSRAASSSSTSPYPPNTLSSPRPSRSEQKSTTQMSRMTKRGACAWECYGRTNGNPAPRSQLFYNSHVSYFRSRCPTTLSRDGSQSNTRTTGSATTRLRRSGLGNGLFLNSYLWIIGEWDKRLSLI